MPAQVPLPPKAEAICSFGHRIRTRQPAGSQLPCTRCHVEDGRTVMVTVPAGVGNAPTIKPPEPPTDRSGMAQILRTRSNPTVVICTGCRAEVQLSSPPLPGEPAGWITVGVGTPDGPEGRKSELLGRFCGPECLAVTLPLIKSRLSELPYAPPDRVSNASTIDRLMSEIPRGR